MLNVTMDGTAIILDGQKIGVIQQDGEFFSHVVSPEFVARKLDGQASLPVGAVLFLAKMDVKRLRRAA